MSFCCWIQGIRLFFEFFQSDTEKKNYCVSHTLSPHVPYPNPLTRRNPPCPKFFTIIRA